MTLPRDELLGRLHRWLRAWDARDLDGVMALFHDRVVFENWTGARVEGREALRRAWAPWFDDPAGFRFVTEDLFADETAQKALYRWTLEWPSREPGFEGRPERRRGVDCLAFRDGLVVEKLTYARTAVEIGGERVRLRAAAPG